MKFLYNPCNEQNITHIFCFQSRSDLEFLWEIFKKGGMNVPTLNAVLNFEVEGLQNVLTPRKVIVFTSGRERK